MACLSMKPSMQLFTKTVSRYVTYRRDWKNRNAETLNIEDALTHNLSLVKVDHLEVGRTLLDLYALELDLLRNGQLALTNARLHVLNMHRPLEPDQIEMLKELRTCIGEYVKEIVDFDGNDDIKLNDRLWRIRELVAQAACDQIQGNIDGRFSHKNNELVLSTLFRSLNASVVVKQMLLLAQGESKTPLAPT